MNKLVAIAFTLVATSAFAAEGDLDQMTTNEVPAAAAAATATPEPAASAATAESAPPAAAAPTEPAKATSPKMSVPPPDKVAKPKGIYEGMYTFDWKKLTRCQIIGPVTNAMLTDPKNVCKKADKETNGPASCKISEKSEYLIFKTLADCKLEQEEQVKAAP